METEASKNKSTDFLKFPQTQHPQQNHPANQVTRPQPRTYRPIHSNQQLASQQQPNSQEQEQARQLLRKQQREQRKLRLQVILKRLSLEQQALNSRLAELQQQLEKLINPAQSLQEMMEQQLEYRRSVDRLKYNLRMCKLKTKNATLELQELEQET